MFRSLDIRVRDSVFDPRSGGGKVTYRQSAEGSTLYRVHVFLEGADLPYVKTATYRLHPSFDPAVQIVRRSASNPNCRLTIWTWGLFEVEVTVEDKFGATTGFVHRLTYGDEVEAAPEEKFRVVE